MFRAPLRDREKEGLTGEGILPPAGLLHVALSAHRVRRATDVPHHSIPHADRTTPSVRRDLALSSSRSHRVMVPSVSEHAVGMNSANLYTSHTCHMHMLAALFLWAVHLLFRRSLRVPACLWRRVSSFPDHTTFVRVRPDHMGIIWAQHSTVGWIETRCASAACCSPVACEGTSPTHAATFQVECCGLAR